MESFFKGRMFCERPIRFGFWVDSGDINPFLFDFHDPHKSDYSAANPDSR